MDYGQNHPFGVTYGEPIPTENEIWRDETVYRMAVGAKLDATDLEAGMVIDRGCPLCVNLKTRIAKPVKNVRVVEAASDADTTLKIAKGSLVKAGEYIGDGSKKAQISSIDKSNASYDTLTLAATLGVAIAVDAVLHQCTSASAKASQTANFMNYRRVQVLPASSRKQTLAFVGRAYEIENLKLTNPCSESDKTALGARFLFIN